MVTARDVAQAPVPPVPPVPPEPVLVWVEPAVDARAELNPLGDQVSHLAQLNKAFDNACVYATEWKVQSRFRDLYLAYRERYLTPVPQTLPPPTPRAKTPAEAQVVRDEVDAETRYRRGY